MRRDRAGDRIGGDDVALRGIRGAVTVNSNSGPEIVSRTRELLEAIVSANSLKPEAISMAIFTVTPDLDAAFPAQATRELADRGRVGWRHVPAMCATEVAVPGALPRAVRVLLLAETRRAPRAIRHQYLGEASCLRPDLAEAPSRRKRRRGAKS